MSHLFFETLIWKALKREAVLTKTKDWTNIYKEKKKKKAKKNNTKKTIRPEKKEEI